MDFQGKIKLVAIILNPFIYSEIDGASVARKFRITEYDGKKYDKQALKKNIFCVKL